MKHFNLSSLRGLLLGCFLAFVCSDLRALDYFWVGGSGNWTDFANHWATASGGATFQTDAPSDADNVFFDANSFSAAATVTVNTANAFCRNMDWTGATNTPALAGTGSLNIYGSLTFIADMTVSVSGSFLFSATTAGHTVGTAGHSLPGNVFFDGDPGGWILTSALTSGGDITHFYGTLNTAGFAVTADAFITDEANPAIGIFGASTITAAEISLLYTPATNLDADETTLVATSAVNVSLDAVLNDVTFTGANAMYTGTDGSILGDLTFNASGTIEGSGNIVQTATFAENGFLFGSNTFDALVFSPGKTYELGEGSTTTVSTTFTASGNDCYGRTSIFAFSFGAQGSISMASGTLNLAFLTLQNVGATGGATFNATSTVDLGQNSGWNITTPTARDMFWVGGDGNWNDIAHWAPGSGGTGGECLPTPYDDVFFDAGSGFAANADVNVDAPAFCADFDWTGVTGNPAFYGNGDHPIHIYGSMTLVAGMVWDFDGFTFMRAPTTGKIVTTLGKTIPGGISFNGAGGWDLAGVLNLHPNTGLLFHVNGTLNTNDHDITSAGWIAYGNAGAVANLGTSDLHIDSGNFNYAPASNLDADATDMFVTADFSFADGCTFKDLTFSQNATFVGNNGVVTETLRFEKTGELIGTGSTVEIGEFLGNGIFEGTASMQTATFTPGKTYSFRENSVLTIPATGNLNATGTSVARITIRSFNSTSPGAIAKDGDLQCFDYLTLDNVLHTGTSGFYAGANSINQGGNTGWVFTECPVGCSTPTAFNVTGGGTICEGDPGVSVGLSGSETDVNYQLQVGGFNTGSPVAGTGSALDFGPQTADGAYTVLATTQIGGCANFMTGSALVVVNTLPSVNQPVNKTVCHAASVTAYTFAGGPSGTVYNWTNSEPSIGLAASGSGNIAAFPGQNSTTANVVATITVTPTRNGCSGPAKTFTITIKATPIMVPVSSFGVCPGVSVSSIALSSQISGATYSWTNSKTTIGLAASGSGNIPAFTATNAQVSNINATMGIKGTFSGCVGPVYNFTLTVFAVPKVTQPTNRTHCHSNTTLTVLFGGGAAGTIYNWTNDNPSIGLAASGTGQINPFVAQNTTSSPVVATVNVTPTKDGCFGLPKTFTFTINPSPAVDPLTPPTYCANFSAAETVFTTTMPSPTFAWTNSKTTIGLASSGSGNLPAFTTTNTGTTNILATIGVQATAAGCTGPVYNYIITVLPAPKVTQPTAKAYCHGSNSTTISFAGGSSGTTYHWTNDNTSIGLAASGTGSITAFPVTNPGTTPVVANVTVTPMKDGCSGTPRTFTVTAKPKPVLDPFTYPTMVFHNDVVSEVVLTCPVAGTTFGWTNTKSSIGLAATGSGNLPMFTAMNTGSTNVIASIKVTPTAAGCKGAFVSKSLTVKPLVFFGNNSNSRIVQTGGDIFDPISNLAFRLDQNRPNPFQGQTTVSFFLPGEMEAELSVFDALGRRVVLKKTVFAAGENTVRLQASELGGTGAYFVRLRAGGFSAERKMILAE